MIWNFIDIYMYFNFIELISLIIEYKYLILIEFEYIILNAIRIYYFKCNS